MTPRFRAWDTHEQKMFSNNELIIWGGNVYLDESKGLPCRNLKCRSISDEYLMQSTGLKDKNGKEIFEGDIVDFKGRKAIIKWHGAFASFIYRFIDEPQERKPKWDPLFLAYLKLEIIGNIYENPELLEVE